jgi:Tfp pilus assembly pilus retraction ATPase PilT
VIETSSEDGMISLNQSLTELVRAGEVSAEVAYRYSIDPRGLDRLI